MKRIIYILFVLSVLLVIPIKFINAQVTVNVKIDTSMLLIGDQTNVVFEASFPESLMVSMPVFSDTIIDKLEKKETYKPLPDSLHIGESKIHGQGLIAKENISEGTDLGVSHYRKNDHLIRTPLGGFINHSEEPNITRKQITIEPYWDKWTVTTTKDIKKDEELTLKYTMYKVDNAN